MSNGVAVTGLGALSSIGLTPEAMLESLRAGRGGLREIATFDTTGLKARHAGEILDWRGTDHFDPVTAVEMDRNSQFAIVAARQAVAQAGLSPELLRSGRVAVIYGVCTGGIGAAESPGILFNSSTFIEAASSDDPEAEKRMLKKYRNTPAYVPTQAVAADLGITGPRMTVSNACAASTSAMAAALTMLEAGRVDAVLVGGSEAWSKFVFASFYSVGAMSPNPTSPFSRAVGASFGEASGCIVLERPAHARARGATIQGVLLACGATSDAHHITSPNPAGEGLMRAMKLAMADAGLEPAAIQYVNAHGTGTADNDVAETLAIRRAFNDKTPPVSSTKSFYGHTLGAAGVLEFITSLISMKAGFLPPTLNFEEHRQGCDLDYVPNVARPCEYDTFISLSAAFGGLNAVAIGARAEHLKEAPPRQITDTITVTGIGVVSPIGFGKEAFRDGLLSGTPGIKPITRFNASPLTFPKAGMVQDLQARRLAPMADTRRMDPITQFAVVAATLALKDAGLLGRILPERIGIFVSLSDGPTSSTQRFGEELAEHGLEGLGARFFPAMVLSTIGGNVGQACQIRGAGFTLTDGAGAGLAGLALAHDYLLQHEELDALVVIGADEIAMGTIWANQRAGLLSPAGATLYDDAGDGIVMAEGSVALVIERTGTAQRRGQGGYARIAGLAMGAEPRADEQVDESGALLADVASRALAAAGGATPDVVYGMARGAARHDRREAAGLKRLLGDQPVPVTCLNGQLGFASATSGLYAAAAAMLGMRHGEAYPTVGAGSAAAGLKVVQGEPLQGRYGRALVLGSNEFGHSTALVFEGT